MAEEPNPADSTERGWTVWEDRARRLGGAASAAAVAFLLFGWVASIWSTLVADIALAIGAFFFAVMCVVMAVLYWRAD